MKLLDFETTGKILQDYNIPLIKTRKVLSKREALIFAKKFGYPVVLKLLAENVVHKTEKGFVEKKIRDGKELEKSFQRIFQKKKIAKGSSLLVQKKGEGIELIIGMKRDPVFGPVLILGLGGVFVELFQKVVFGIAPLNKKEAREMVRATKILEISRERKILPQEGGSFGLDNILVGISKISEEHSEIKEIDFNPIFLNPKETTVADAKFLV